MSDHGYDPTSRRLLASRSAADFTSRGVKLRLFAALGAVMLVLAIAERAWEASFRQRLFGGLEANAVRPIDSRLAPQPSRAVGEPGAFISPARTSANLSGSNPQDDGSQPNLGDRAWQQGWREVLERLSGSQRTMLFELLHLADRGQTLIPERKSAGAEAVRSIGELWEAYRSAAFQSLADLPASQRDELFSALGQVELQWIAEVQPALSAVSESRAPTDSELAALSALQQTLDELVLARVEDDTLFLRPAERECWLRLESRAQATPAADLRRQSIGEIGYTQLFMQPQQYRGQIVTIRGTLMYAYAVAAPDNYLGVKQRYGLWIMPAGGPTSPIVVYALDLPSGFPPIKPPIDGQLAKIREEVSVTGFFLKRGAYQATDGPRTAPLIIANVPQWHPAPAETGGNLRYGLVLRWLWPTIGAALVIALAVVSSLCWLTIRNERQGRGRGDQRLAAADFRGVAIGPSTEQALAELEKEVQGK